MFLTATREPVFPPVRLHFLPAETALTRNWHSPRSHSGTLSSRKRSGSLEGKKPRCESHFTRNVEPRYLQSRFLLQRANHKTDLFFLRPFFFPIIWLSITVTRIVGEFSWFIPREILLESSLVYGPDTSIFIIIRNLKNIGS